MRWPFISSKLTILQRFKYYWIAILIFILGIILTFFLLQVYQQKLSSPQQMGWHSWEILIIGTSLSALTSGYLLMLINRRLLVENEVFIRTEQLARMNRILQKEVGERHRIEDDLKKRQRYLQRRHKALIYLTQMPVGEIKDDLNTVMRQAVSVMNIDRISIWFFDPPPPNQPSCLTCLGVYDSRNPQASAEIHLDAQHYPSYLQTLRNETHLIIPAFNQSINQELDSYLTQHSILAKMDMPILFEGQLLGILACEMTNKPREWQLEDRHFGKTIADIIALKLEQDWRRKMEQALRENEQQLRLITQTAIDAIISASSNKTIISWNFGAEEMFGYKEKEILGQSLNVLLPEQHKQLFSQALKAEEMVGKNKAGHFFPIEISLTQWTRDDQSFYTLIIRDITERKEYERKLIGAIREAKEANQTKDEFLATISHELRTPLNAIIGFNQCLLIGMDGPVTPAQQSSLKKVEHSSFYLLHLINDLLDLAKIESNKVDLELSSQNIVELASSCIEEIEPLAKEKSLPISLTVDKPIIRAQMDPLKIRQVLLNLLSNAIKFTEKGFIELCIVEQENGIEIHVKDTGIGIAPGDLPKVFKPFSQVDSSITRKYGGTGLGLAISKKIVDLHKGFLWVESEKGNGSTFIIFLPKN